MREEAAVIGDQMEAGGIAVQRLTGAEENGADHEKGDDRQHLNQREPELHFGKPLHADHIHGADDSQRAEGEDPLRHIAKRAPVVHIQRHGGDIDNPGHRPVNEVHPAGHVSGFFTEELPCIRDEAAARGAVEDQFAEGAKNKEGEDAADQIDQGERWPCHL